MEDESTQPLASEQELAEETNQHQGAPDIENSEPTEEAPGGQEYPQNAQEEDHQVIPIDMYVDNNTSEIAQTNNCDDQVYINVRGDHEKIQPKNFYEMINSEIYRSNGIEKDFPIDLCLDIQENIDNIVPFLQKSMARRRRR
ncbi:hypothetical protein OJ253_1246 [Cryptosporidium canis]|uniref:Uncharacterized protein n=1 Tax=Cryptosporidium canis TaxID=195482 RepID=A0A9D5DI27_9CRYT|nr:hypothetical protein OJ253_1246 [Cryptosporidium canis]